MAEMYSSDSSDYYSFSPAVSLSLDSLQLPDECEPRPKRRGRRPVRPNDPVKKKTEEMDKYWLRAFRAHAIQEKDRLVHTNPDFWVFYLSRDGKPRKGHQFRSYGKVYKSFLFTSQDFTLEFRKWFDETGEQILSRKYEVGSDEWFVYFDYAAKDLYYHCSGTKVHEEQMIADEIDDLPLDELLIDEDFARDEFIL